MLENLNKYKILLGSKSPRRRELMQLLDIPLHRLDWAMLRRIIHPLYPLPACPFILPI